MKRLFSISVFIIQAVAFYLQIYDIASSDTLRIVLYSLGGMLMVIAFWLCFEKKWKAAIKCLLEGILMVGVAYIAGDFQRQEERWSKYVTANQTTPDYSGMTSMQLYEAAVKASEKREYSTAIKIADMASKKGNGYAYDLLGQLYALGYGCQQDYETAAYCFSQAGCHGVYNFPKWLKRFPELLNIDNDRVKEEIEENAKYATLMDSLQRLTLMTIERLGTDKTMSLWDNNYETLVSLSKKGYNGASCMLLRRAEIKGNEDECAAYANRLVEQRMVPDAPKQRYFFLRELGKELPEPDDELGLGEINRLIENQDFFLTLVAQNVKAYSNMQRNGTSQIDIYRYNLAQFERCKFLKNSREEVISFYYPEEDFDKYYDFAKFCLAQSIKFIENQKAGDYPSLFQ